MIRLLSLFTGIVTLVIFAGCNNGDTKGSTSTLKGADAALFTKPMMGWNSFDAFDSRITEAEFREIVDYMADNLLQYGWDYAVIDYIWWHPSPGDWPNPEKRFGHPNIRYDAVGKPLDPTTIDEYGRLLPAVERFPSAAGGKGFAPLAEYVHSKGMKFGIHIMRGIHRYAWYYDLPVKGTGSSARNIAEQLDT
ncbi:MAG: glycoside hydrolase family 27 protein, partial [Bacteroidales bacterium]|nr:glycoside hydrolase family 27 protein [Bacteroidales bacterium]